MRSHMHLPPTSLQFDLMDFLDAATPVIAQAGQRVGYVVSRKSLMLKLPTNIEGFQSGCGFLFITWTSQRRSSVHIIQSYHTPTIWPRFGLGEAEHHDRLTPWATSCFVSEMPATRSGCITV